MLLLSEAATYKEFREEVKTCERLLITRSLSYNNGNVTKTAKALGIQRKHLYRKLYELGIRIKKV